MAMTNDPDETNVLRLNIVRRRIEQRLAADGLIDAEDAATLIEFDALAAEIGLRTRRRRALEAYQRNGLNPYTRRLLRDAGLAIDEADDDWMPDAGAHIAASNGEPIRLAVHMKTRHRGANHDDAA
jgi:hypothetical protein